MKFQFIQLLALICGGALAGGLVSEIAQCIGFVRGYGAGK